MTMTITTISISMSIGMKFSMEISMINLQFELVITFSHTSY